MRECNFYSTAGFLPSMWGPGVWNLIHMTAANFPCQPTPEDRRRYEAFLESLADVLPCAACRSHFRAMLEGRKGRSLQLTAQVLRDRFTLFDWTVRVHNAVNRRLGKPVYADSGQWFVYYDRMRAN